MALIRLNNEWSLLMERYRDNHQNKVNQACHMLGIPLIVTSLPVAMTIVGLLWAAAMFGAGWMFQFVGHSFERKKPSFVEDWRFHVTGLLWWTNKLGLNLVEQTRCNDRTSNAVD